MPILSNKNLKICFLAYFFNKGISFNIPWKSLEFKNEVHDGLLEGPVSQNSYLGLSFYVMKSRKFEKSTPVTHFIFYIKQKTKT